MILSDLGADVVMVEHPAGGDPARSVAPEFHAAMARGKRSVTLDLKQRSGREALDALLAKADVVLDGYRPGTLARLGFDRDRLAQLYPRLVYVAISGYGQDGPFAARPGHDLTYQAEAGLLAESLESGEVPEAPTLALGDLVAGLLAVQAVLLGLVRRERTSKAPVVDVSMFDGLVALLAAHIGPVINGAGSAGFPYEPGYGVFRTSDDALIALGVAHEDHFWSALCDVVGMRDDRELSSTERFAEHDRLHSQLAAALRTKPIAEWEQVFTTADVPFGRVRSLAEMPESAQVLARDLVQQAGERRYVRQPLVVDGLRPGPRGDAPALGEHTEEVLAEAGLTAAEIEAVRVAVVSHGG